MPTTRSFRPARALTVLVTATTAMLVAAVPGTGLAEPAPTVAQVQVQVTELNQEAAVAAERYDDATYRADQAQTALGAAEQKVTRQRGVVSAARKQLGGLASAAYRKSGVDPTAALLTSRDPGDFLASQALLDQLNAHQAEVLRRVVVAKSVLDRDETTAQRQYATLRGARAEAEQQKSAVLGKLAEAQRVLNTLQAQERARIEAAQKAAAEAARQQAAAAAAQAQQAAEAAAQQAAAERAAAAAARAQDAQQAVAERTAAVARAGRSRPTTTRVTPKATAKATPKATAKSAKKTTSRTTSSSAATTSSSAVTSQASARGAAAAVAFAYAQIGDPYVWGATGPGSWDCSGLTMGAWRAAGVSLPHSSSAQYSSGRKVSIGALQPGDLVFYYSPISHVAIYVGGGKIIHAPRPGEPVQVASLHEMPITGAVRP